MKHLRRMQRFCFFQVHRAAGRTNQMMSAIVMTMIGDVRRPWQGERDEFFLAPPGFCWRFVPEGPFAVQFRSILRMHPRAVVVWVGPGEAVDRAANMIARLVEIGPAVVIGIAEEHDPSSESVLRSAGALYICSHEAEQRLDHLLGSILEAHRVQIRLDPTAKSNSIPAKAFDGPWPPSMSCDAPRGRCKGASAWEMFRPSN